MGTLQASNRRAIEFSQLIGRIWLGNCLDLLARVPNGAVHLIVSSPPYNIGKEYESRVELDRYLVAQSKVLAECARVLAPTGSLFWQVGAFADRGVLVPLDIKFFPILESLGLLPRNRIIWARQHGLHATKKFSCRHESILWFTKSDRYTFNLDAIRVPQKYQNKRHFRGERKGELSCHPDGKNPGDIWLFRNVKHNHEEQTIHPCQFPEDMIARIVLATTTENQLVLDPYMGAGTVAVVARDHGRRYLGAECDEGYHRVALQRLSGEPDEVGMFPNLKTLRDYCERTGMSVDKYRFAVQVGDSPTDRSQSKILPEPRHLVEMERRLSHEETCFSAALRRDSLPLDGVAEGRKRDLSLFS